MRTLRTRQFDRQDGSFKICVASFGDRPLQHRMARAIAAATMPIVVLHTLLPWRCRSADVTLTESVQASRGTTRHTEQGEQSP
ncbi:MAG: hypothetical protein MUP13_15975 [Thermoanaerobaculales bacterium]|nr:hypothetical protein [Thermoanaerobaculales bacterium]